MEENDLALETVMADLRRHVARQFEELRERGFDDQSIVAAYRTQFSEEESPTRPH